jgi:hypothetical protein
MSTWSAARQSWVNTLLPAALPSNKYTWNNRRNLGSVDFYDVHTKAKDQTGAQPQDTPTDSTSVTTWLSP